MIRPQITFPDNKNGNIKYYRVHYLYFLNVLKSLSLPIMMKEMTPIDSVGFEMYIDNKKVIIDFSDHLELLPCYDEESGIPYFKYHYAFEKHSACKNVYPFTPVSFHDWNVYNNHKNKIKYNASGMILNNQRPGGNAIDRREKVQELLNSASGIHVNTHFYSNQLIFWQLINKCLVSVCVPGARNDMLDRGQLQYMAFGCCTISPGIKCILPRYKMLEPSIHYIECKSDYSDLIEKIEWCRNNRNACLEIGQNAKQLFEETSAPMRLWYWILECLENK